MSFFSLAYSKNFSAIAAKGAGLTMASSSGCASSISYYSRSYHRRVGPLCDDLEPYHVGEEPQLQDVAIDHLRLLDVVLVVNLGELLLVTLQARNN